MRVLIVDDWPDSAESTAVLLRLGGHEVAFALSGAAALRSAAAEKPEAVFLDIDMPGMDGYELARRLRQLGRGIRLIALTGHDADERSRAAGFDGHLTKPADPMALLELCH